MIGVVSQSLNVQPILAQLGTAPQNVNYAVKADYIAVLLPPSAATIPASQLQAIELSALVSTLENSVVRIVAKP